MTERIEALDAVLRSMDRVVVAFSAGVDSTVLLAQSLAALGPDRVLAVTTRSPSVPASEIAQAEEIAAELGAAHRVIDSNELERPDYVANTGDRCYHCRREMYTLIGAVARAGLAGTVIDGANVDDEGDHRPGMRAASELGVRSPFREIRMTKAEIREIAKSTGLSNWDKPQAACLASRIPVGTRVTVDRLSRVEAGEEFLKEMGFRQVRLRHHEEIARIEVGPEELPLWGEAGIRSAVIQKLKELGYRYVTLDLDGYRTGSLSGEEGDRK